MREYPYIETICRVCGYDMEVDMWIHGSENALYPGHNICDCCGNHSGENDTTMEDIRLYRNHWIQKGRPWFDWEEERPSDEFLDEQMKNIPGEYR